MRTLKILLASLFIALLTTTGCKKKDDTPPPIRYTVTFDSQGADVEAVPTSMTVTFPATTLDEFPTPPEKTNYDFGGWYTEVDGGGSYFSDFTEVTEDITVYAKWIQVVFSVSYDINGGTIGSVPVDNNSYDYNELATVLGGLGGLAGPVIRDGIRQRFLGWYTDPDGTTYPYNEGDLLPITEDITLYAIYTTDNDVLRKVGPAGGWVFYDAGSTESWGRYLEAANPDWETTNPAWPWEGDDPVSEWGLKPYQGVEPVQIINEAYTEIGTGLSNTNIITSFYGDLYLKSDGTTSYYDYDWAGLTSGIKETFTDGVSDYEFGSMWEDYDGIVAAKVCSDYSLEYNDQTYDDWFLPSKDELNQMYLNLCKEGVGGFAGTGASYWSSSQYDAWNAWYQHFGFLGPEDGPQDYSGNASVYWFRAVRAF